MNQCELDSQSSSKSKGSILSSLSSQFAHDGSRDGIPGGGGLLQDLDEGIGQLLCGGTVNSTNALIIQNMLTHSHTRQKEEPTDPDRGSHSCV